MLGWRHAVGGAGDGVGIEDDLLGLRPDRRDQQVAHADHCIAGGEPIDAGADFVDDSGEIPTDADLPAGGHQAALGQPAGSGGDIDGIHRGGLDPNPHLTVRRFRHGHVGELQHLRTAEATNDYSFHAGSSWAAVISAEHDKTVTLFWEEGT